MMEVAPVYKLLVHCLQFSLFTLLILLFKLLYTVACVPIDVVREGWNAIGTG